MVNLIEHPKEPKTVLCRRADVLEWTGWSVSFLKKLVASGLVTPLNLLDGRNYYYTAEIKKIMTEGDN